MDQINKLLIEQLRLDSEKDKNMDIYKKGQEFLINIGDGDETVTVRKRFNAGLGSIKFITLNTKNGAPYTLSLAKFKKVLVRTKKEE